MCVCVCVLLTYLSAAGARGRSTLIVARTRRLTACSRWPRARAAAPRCAGTSTPRGTTARRSTTAAAAPTATTSATTTTVTPSAAPVDQLQVNDNEYVVELGPIVCSCEVSSVDIRYDTRCYFNVRSKADASQLNLPHGTNN